MGKSLAILSSSPRQSKWDEKMDVNNQYCYFFEDQEFKETNREGFRRRVITGEHTQLWFWRIRGGSVGSIMHNHAENEQLGIIMRGKLDFRIGDKGSERVVLGEGEVYLAPKSVWHGDSLFVGDDELNEVWILDVFSPPRTDI